MLEELGYPADVVQAIRGHAPYLQVPRETLMAKTLYASDELSGFISAVAQVHPNKSIAEVSVNSVKKKLKDKRFAANVNREEVHEGAAELGVTLDDHIAFLIEVLKHGGDARALS